MLRCLVFRVGVLVRGVGDEPRGPFRVEHSCGFRVRQSGASSRVKNGSVMDFEKSNEMWFAAAEALFGTGLPPRKFPSSTMPEQWWPAACLEKQRTHAHAPLRLPRTRATPVLS